MSPFWFLVDIPFLAFAGYGVIQLVKTIRESEYKRVTLRRRQWVTIIHALRKVHSEGARTRQWQEDNAFGVSQEIVDQLKGLILYPRDFYQ